ncbi:MAG: elongation factor Ts [Verrucomicrobia bacterium]|nr:elongation factor Ts [Verrucomicrobiota bacterium]
MSEISAELVKELRRRTGVGIGKCKEALEQSRGDIEAAIANLRKSGIASANKKADRETREGMIVSSETKETVALVEVNAETDFVVANEKFQRFAADLAAEAATTAPKSVEAFVAQRFSKEPSITIDELRAEIIQNLGENIVIRRLLTLPKGKERSIGIYSHMGGKIVTLVELEGSQGESDLARDIAMHIAAESPDYLSPEEVPVETRQNEEAIAREQVKGKPANVIDKIVEGKLRAFYEEVCLLHQKFVRNPEISIAKLLENRGKEIGAPLKIERFLRWQVGQ